MTIQGVLILVAFFVFAGFMITKVLPTILALPLMAIIVCLIAGMPFLDIINKVILGGSTMLSSAMMVVVFGAMFAQVIMKTGISSSIIKKAAELAGDSPRPIAFVITLAVAFVFLGMSGLGAVIMIGSIAIPILMSAGIKPVVVSSLLLFGIQAGLSANMAAYGTFIGVFGGEMAINYYMPSLVLSVGMAVVFIFINVKPERKVSMWAAGTLTGNGKPKQVPALALITPIIPLVTVFAIKGIWGLGAADKGMADAVAAAILGFIIASLFAIVITNPRRITGIFSAAIIEGIKDVAGVIFLFVGIGMLVAAVMNPAVSGYLNPIIRSIVPSSPIGVLIFFAVLSPIALYRGPLNLFGMGSGIAVLLLSLDILPVMVVAGAFLAVGYIQVISDPTNSHNVWISDYANVETGAVLRMTLPYTWAMCVLMLLYVVFTKW